MDDQYKDLLLNVWHLPADEIERVRMLYNFKDYKEIHRVINEFMYDHNTSAEQLDLTEVFQLLSSGGRRAKLAASFEVKPHEYLWNPYLPNNDVTILMAPGGTGKTMLCCWILAQVSKGGYIPGDADYYSQYESKKTGIEPAPKVGLYISSEDDGSEIRARLEASGADLSKVAILDRIGSEGMTFDEEGYDEFVQTIKDVNPALVIIDPWSAFIGKNIDVTKVNHVRPAMQRLAVIANECHCSIILISHVNKKPQAENINNAAIGSTDFVNAARSALTLIFSDDENDPDGRIMVHTKANYSAAGESLKFNILPVGAFEYTGRSDVTRQTLEDAARNRRTVAEQIEARKVDKAVSDNLIEAVSSYAKPGEFVIIAYDQFCDDFGDDIFGKTNRPSTALKKIQGRLKDKGITLEFNTTNGNAKRTAYNGKNKNGVEIFLKPKQERG